MIERDWEFSPGMTEEIAPRLTVRFVSLPVPAGLQAWVVWDEGHVVGPFLVLAMMQRTETISHAARVEARSTKRGRVQYRIAGGSWQLMDAMPTEETAEYLSGPMYLLAWPDYGDQDEELWQPSSRIFFDEARAREAAPQKAEAFARRQEQLQRDRDAAAAEQAIEASKRGPS